MLYHNTKIVMLINCTSYQKIWVHSYKHKRKQEEKRNKMNMGNVIQQKKQLRNYFG